MTWHFLPWYHFTTVMWHFLPWCHFTIVMWHFLSWYHFTSVMGHFLPWYHFTTVMEHFLLLPFYKITKIVRELWLAERRVCMRVCKHSCDVKMFCFSRANHASTNLKKVLSWKTWQVYFIYPFPRRLKLEKSLETSCVCCAYQLICIMTISTYTTGARTHFFTVQEPSWRVISALAPVV